MDNRRFYLWSAAIVLLAFVLREWYVLVTQVIGPVRGDVRDYVAYAMNLRIDGVFSATTSAPPVPDAYRGPGHPLFLAMFYSPDHEAWFAAVRQAQVLLGTLTVACVIGIARKWSSQVALLAGVLMATQPHHIAATASLLSEVLLGSAIALGLLAAAYTQRGLWWAAASGAAFGFAYLVNPLVALLPFAILPVFWRHGALRAGSVIALVAMIAVGGWSLRNVAVGASSTDRAAVNFVQGSWPEYHLAVQRGALYPELRRASRQMDAEISMMRSDPRAGLQGIGNRLSSDPLRYTLWYVIEKPYLLWSWGIQLGAGGIYFDRIENSSLEGPLWLIPMLTWLLLPAMFLLALVGCLRSRDLPSQLAAVAFLYFTAMHTVFQAEPRYAIAYRGLELLMAAHGVVWLCGLYKFHRKASNLSVCTAVTLERIPTKPVE